MFIFTYIVVLRNTITKIVKQIINTEKTLHSFSINLNTYILVLRSTINYVIKQLINMTEKLQNSLTNEMNMMENYFCIYLYFDIAQYHYLCHEANNKHGRKITNLILLINI